MGPEREAQGNDWGEWSRYVLRELSRMDAHFEKSDALEARVVKLETEYVAMKSDIGGARTDIGIHKDVTHKNLADEIGGIRQMALRATEQANAFQKSCQDAVKGTRNLQWTIWGAVAVFIIMSVVNHFVK